MRELEITYSKLQETEKCEVLKGYALVRGYVVDVICSPMFQPILQPTKLEIDDLIAFLNIILSSAQKSLQIYAENRKLYMLKSTDGLGPCIASGQCWWGMRAGSVIGLIKFAYRSTCPEYREGTGISTVPSPPL